VRRVVTQPVRRHGQFPRGGGRPLWAGWARLDWWSKMARHAGPEENEERKEIGSRAAKQKWAEMTWAGQRKIESFEFLSNRFEFEIKF
jgi:hypothetical protein